MSTYGGRIRHFILWMIRPPWFTGVSLKCLQQIDSSDSVLYTIECVLRLFPLLNPPTSTLPVCPPYSPDPRPVPYVSIFTSGISWLSVVYQRQFCVCVCLYFCVFGGYNTNLEENLLVTVLVWLSAGVLCKLCEIFALVPFFAIKQKPE